MVCKFSESFKSIWCKRDVVAQEIQFYNLQKYHLYAILWDYNKTKTYSTECYMNAFWATTVRARGTGLYWFSNSFFSSYRWTQDSGCRVHCNFIVIRNQTLVCAFCTFYILALLKLSIADPIPLVILFSSLITLHTTKKLGMLQISWYIQLLYDHSLLMNYEVIMRTERPCCKVLLLSYGYFIVHLIHLSSLYNIMISYFHIEFISILITRIDTLKVDICW